MGESSTNPAALARALVAAVTRDMSVSAGERSAPPPEVIASACTSILAGALEPGYAMHGFARACIASMATEGFDPAAIKQAFADAIDTATPDFADHLSDAAAAREDMARDAGPARAPTVLTAMTYEGTSPLIGAFMSAIQEHATAEVGGVRAGKAGEVISACGVILAHVFAGATPDRREAGLADLVAAVRAGAEKLYERRQTIHLGAGGGA